MTGLTPHPHGQDHQDHYVNPGYKSQELLQQPGLEHAFTSMPDQLFTSFNMIGRSLFHVEVYHFNHALPVLPLSILQSYRNDDQNNMLTKII